MMSEIRYNWKKEEIYTIYNFPLLELIYRAATIHRHYHNAREIQVSSLLSIKTGGCVEDCGYCSQSANHETGSEVHKMLSLEDVLKAADIAKEQGATRMCLGAAWREVRNNKDFDTLLEMVKVITSKNMEVCCTLGMLTEEQAKKLANAGLYAYNHNLDTSEEYYKKIISTRDYKDRLNTLDNIRKAKLTMCCGGIIGMGESVQDRVALLQTLSSLQPHPESVPINALVPVKGTPLEKEEIVSVWDMARMIATARIVMPSSIVRLSAGRLQMSKEGQALCFLAGANSVFAGNKLLTTSNPEYIDDMELFTILGLQPSSIPATTVKEKLGMAIS